jgi:phosphate transport system permease protein
LQNHLEPRLRSVLGPIPIFHSMFYEKVKQADGTWLQQALPLTGRDMFCAGLILSIMIVPIITAISRDVLRAVPRAQIEGTQALGATWWQSSWEMLRYSRSGLFGAVMLGLARAAGETMAVAMVIGNVPKINTSPFQPAQTMASLLANEFAEASGEGQRSALIEVALILLLMSLAFNVVARYLVVGKQSRSAAGH